MRREIVTYACVGAVSSLLLYLYFLLSWNSTYASSPWPGFQDFASHPFFISSLASTRVTAGALVVLTLVCCAVPRTGPLPRAIGACLGVSLCMALLLVVPLTFRRRLL